MIARVRGLRSPLPFCSVPVPLRPRHYSGRCRRICSRDSSMPARESALRSSWVCALNCVVRAPALPRATCRGSAGPFYLAACWARFCFSSGSRTRRRRMRRCSSISKACSRRRSPGSCFARTSTGESRLECWRSLPAAHSSRGKVDSHGVALLARSQLRPHVRVGRSTTTSRKKWPAEIRSRSRCSRERSLARRTFCWLSGRVRRGPAEYPSRKRFCLAL